MNGDVGMHHAKNDRNKKLSKQGDSTIMRNPFPTYPVLQGLRMIVLSPCLDSFLFLSFFAWCIPTSPFIC